jgi:general secretion pathway protein G
MNRGFSLLELLIVVAILGILAAIVMQEFQSHSQEAKETAARDNLQILRHQIELYAAQHNSIPPGYPDSDTSATPTWPILLSQILKATNASGQFADPGTEGYPLGPYLSDIPANPFNDSKTVKMIGNNESFPAQATGTFGWMYKAATKEIRLDWPGTDSYLTLYYDY